MDQKRIDRINELYRKSKAEGLSAAEKQEQQKLREEYRMAIVGNLTLNLQSIKVQQPDGTLTELTPKNKKDKDE